MLSQVSAATAVAAEPASGANAVVPAEPAAPAAPAAATLEPGSAELSAADLPTPEQQQPPLAGSAESVGSTLPVTVAAVPEGATEPCVVAELAEVEGHIGKGHSGGSATSQAACDSAASQPQEASSAFEVSVEPVLLVEVKVAFDEGAAK